MALTFAAPPVQPVVVHSPAANHGLAASLSLSGASSHVAAEESIGAGTYIAVAASTLAAAAVSGGNRKLRRRLAARGQHIARCAEKTAQEGLSSWDTMITDVKATAVGTRLAKMDKARDEGLAPHTDAKVRYFGDGREKPKVVLYRDQAAWCPYCQKVWLLLEEKQVDYEIVKVPMRSYGDKPQEFLQKVPRGLLPAIEINGRLMTESLDIMFAIEAIFADGDRPMFPQDGGERARAIQLLELERNVFSAWCGYLFRPEIPLIGGSSSDFTSALQQVDDELGQSSSPWFLPYQHPTIVDMQYVSHVERMVASVMYYKGYDVRGDFRNIDNWMTAFEKLPYYMASKSDYYTHCMDIPPQYGEPYPNDSQAAMRARALITPKSTRLPVPWNTDPEPQTVDERRMSEAEHRMEAAWSLMNNHDAVVKFCCRGAGNNVGDWGRNNPTRSALSDPYAKANEVEVGAIVDAILRGIAQGLLEEKGDVLETLRAQAETAAGGPPACGYSSVQKCLGYLRDRIGVPRDMSMPAAKLLRAHLSEAILSLQGA